MPPKTRATLRQVGEQDALTEMTNRPRAHTPRYDYNNFIEDGMLLSLGNGSRISFWDGSWIERGILHITFPRIFGSAIKKQGKISNE
ncbi:Uncharacterized protein TCM_041320 [Theobroma cacao]|uniref:Uncharacterized protein n=1 Tax=Theobroma cacao TaxID=3641 RepID=A0A061GZN6_THECC|nr:Uncharacterized protein TCM_041320 [Theobroma cacao]